MKKIHSYQATAGHGKHSITAKQARGLRYMVIKCKECGNPLLAQPNTNRPMREQYEEAKEYVCHGCRMKHVTKEYFDKGAKVVTFIDGKLAPWTPFGMEPDLKNFSRGRESK